MLLRYFQKRHLLYFFELHDVQNLLRKENKFCLYSFYPIDGPLFKYLFFSHLKNDGEGRESLIESNLYRVFKFQFSKHFSSAMAEIIQEVRKGRKRPFSPSEYPNSHGILKTDENLLMKVFKNGKTYSYLSLEDLIALGMTNKEFSNSILLWFTSNEAKNYIFRHLCGSNYKILKGDSPMILQHFRSIGHLLKILTCRLPVLNSLKFVDDILCRFELFNPSNNLTMKSIDLTWKEENILGQIYAKVFYSFVKGWNDNDISLAFPFLAERIEKIFKLDDQIRQFLDTTYFLGKYNTYM